VDLVAGLPHQTARSWRMSLEQLAGLAVPHASVYILEVDEESRLGRELIAGGNRYHAHYVPDSDLAADLYLDAISFLKPTLEQYEISNFSQPGYESRHNLKYWTRQPYLGFGLDAHSMLRLNRSSPEFESVRFANVDDLSRYLSASPSPKPTFITPRSASEETMFLRLRLNRGIDLNTLEPGIQERFDQQIRELSDLGLVEHSGSFLRLTSRGRLLSNEVFERFISTEESVAENRPCFVE